VSPFSGGHLNPAVSLAQAVVKKFQWYKVPVYVMAQILGAFLASVVLYLEYYDALNAYDMGLRQTTGNMSTAGIWATYPKDFLGIWGGIFDQILGTAFLLMCINAITDKRNMKVPGYLVPVLVGMVILGIGLCFGFNCGYGINPARDLSPRIFTAMAGWGTEPFSYNNYQWFWIPILAPLIGGPLGSLLYMATIELHWETEVAPLDDLETMKSQRSLQHSNTQQTTYSEDRLVAGSQDLKA